MQRGRAANDSSIAPLIFPDIKQKLPKDYNKDNKQKIKMKEFELQQKQEEEKNQPKKGEWKMKRFQSVDPKVQNAAIKESGRNNGGKDSYNNGNGGDNSRIMNQKENQFDQQYNQPIHRSNSKGPASIQMDMGGRQNQSKPVLMPTQNRQNSQLNIHSNDSQQYDYQIPLKDNKVAITNRNQRKAVNLTAENIFSATDDYQPSRVVTYDDTTLVSVQENQLKNPHNLLSSQRNLPPQQPKRQNLPPQHPQTTVNSNRPPVHQQPKREIQSQNQTEQRPQHVNKSDNKNYIHDNINGVVNVKQSSKLGRKDTGSKSPTSKHKEFGKVPNYLNKMQKQKDEEIERRRQEEEESKLPPGTRLMPEDERLRTLEDLHQTKKDIINMLEKMPLANQSMALVKKKREMEDKLTRIEKAIETFSKKIVYVAI
ncbi:UNKNOWN [Stylonychia lemnae]|uniref:Enkurin domain-containing protein n=1 Tax=Stylonychia lemnae TaxID=5949 RepID=A0A077ZTU9_STYLE|nr:UNKNOWN [Stylonychia lemnae]|eukprot:CDW72994.1 UNKNOWN [Stylonychia lemnae]